MANLANCHTSYTPKNVGYKKLATPYIDSSNEKNTAPQRIFLSLLEIDNIRSVLD